MTSLLFSAFSKLISSYVGRLHDDTGSRDIDRLRMSLLYVKGVKTLRLLFVAGVAVGICMVLLLSGLTFFGLTLLFFTPLAVETKMYIGFGAALVLCGAAAFAFQQIFSPARWMDMFHTKELLEEHPDKDM